jgi:hypothetical protein
MKFVSMSCGCLCTFSFVKLLQQGHAFAAAITLCIATVFILCAAAES